MLEMKDLEILKCNADEFVFITYDGSKDPEMTSDVLNDVIEFCQENGTPCLCVPKDDTQFDVSLSQMDASQLRRLDERIQAEIKKKSKIILE